ncbi:MAG TPA: radical SAM protein [Rhodospirillales bacterium]|nr:radical SAM protein [Rhodospirillales bacterium]
MSRSRDYPSHLDVDLSGKCNLRCTFCHLSYFEPKDSAQMDFGTFKDWFGPLLPHLGSITLFSKYEPLVCHDFIPIFNFVAGHGMETYFSTNGLLIDEAILDAIVGRLTYITVSVTGFTPETYAKYMGSDGLARARRNLADLNALKAERDTPYPILRISTVGMKDTLGELVSAVDFADEFKAAEGVQVTSLAAYVKEMVDKMPLSDPEQFNKATEKARRHAEKKGVKFVLQSGGLDDNAAETGAIGHRPCALPWQRLSVQANGDVFPCSVARRPVGDLNCDTLAEIWSGPALKAFRSGVNDPRDMNEDCRACAHCRYKSVVDAENNDFSESAVHYAGMTRKTRS